MTESAGKSCEYLAFLQEKLPLFEVQKALLLLSELHYNHLSCWRAEDSQLVKGKVIWPQKKKEAAAQESVKDTSRVTSAWEQRFNKAEILPRSWLNHPRLPPCAPHLEGRQQHNWWPESFIGEWKLTTLVILVSLQTQTGLTFINKACGTFINLKRYARPPHHPVNCVFDQIKVKLITLLRDSGSGKLLVRAQSGKYDHRSLCVQVPYEGLIQARGCVATAQVMMSVERGQVYFGKGHTSVLISPLHETHSWLLLAWPLPHC